MKKRNFWRGLLISLVAVVLNSCKEDDAFQSEEMQEFSSELSFKAGTENDVSPFSGEEGFLFLQWLMNSRLAQMQDCVPMATILITSEEDIVEAESLSELKKITLQNEEMEVIRDEKSNFFMGKQILKLASQVITIKWGYEIYDSHFGDIPYLTLGKPEVVNCKVEENGENYEVVVHIRQKLSSVGLQKNFLKWEEYVLKYTGVIP